MRVAGRARRTFAGKGFGYGMRESGMAETGSPDANEDSCFMNYEAAFLVRAKRHFEDSQQC